MKQIFKIFGFILAVVVLLQLLSLLLTERYDQLDCGKMNYHFSGIYGEKKDSIDVLLIGDSECYSGFSPMEMWEQNGFTAYGVGTLAQNLQETYEYLRDVLRNQSPKVVVLETDSLFSVFTKVTLDDILRSHMRMAFPGIDSHDSWRVLWKNQEKQNRYVDDSKGYYHVYEAQAPLERHLKRYMAPSDEQTPMEARRLGILKQILKLCRQHAIQPVLVSTPSTKNWDMGKHNRVEALSQELQVPYVDLNLMCEEMGFDWNLHTQDGGDHLNHEGAVLVSKYLGSWLDKAYGLPDHRQAEGFESWEESLRNYKDLVLNQVSNKKPNFRLLKES